MKTDSVACKQQAAWRQQSAWRQWVDQDLDGELEVSGKARLAELLENEPEVRAEQRTLRSLRRLLEGDRIPVRPGFAARVMESLPQAWWERARVPAGLSRWALPLAMMLALALAAAWFLGSAEETPRIAGIGLAVLDFMQVTFLAGAGMLFATWRGFGFGIEALAADSGLSLLALAAAVLCLDLLFFSLLRRRRRAALAAESDGSDDG